MFYHTWKMARMTLRVLLRNKLFLFFAVFMMVMATLLLNVSIDTSKKSEGNVVWLDKHSAQMAYLEDVEKFQVKLYNQNENGNELAERIGKAGMFQIFVADAKELSVDEIEESINYTAMHDKVDAIIVVKAGDIKDSVSLHQTGDDERYEFLEKYVDASIVAMANDSADTGKNVEVVTLEKTQETGVWDMEVDSQKTTILGNVLAIYSAAFLFSGILILGTIITERDNRVYTRILLSSASPYSYMLSKFLVVIMATVLETAVALLSFALLVHTEIGVSVFQMGLILMSLGVIFNSISVGIGTCCGSTLTASIVGISIWTVTSLLGGMYFDISNASTMYKRIATVMPQRWGLKAASLFMNGNNLGYPLIIIVSITYVVVILLVGVLGLKLSSRE